MRPGLGESLWVCRMEEVSQGRVGGRWNSSTLEHGWAGGVAKTLVFVCVFWVCVFVFIVRACVCVCVCGGWIIGVCAVWGVE